MKKHGLPSLAFLRASLATWRQRYAYRHRRLDHWRHVGNAPKVAKWTRLVVRARKKVHLRENQIARRSRVSVHGIDVSNNNGHVSMAAVAGHDESFVYAKATEGLGFVDTFFRSNVSRAHQAGMYAGAYHFLRPSPGHNARQEARAFATVIGHTKLELLPVVDVEVTAFAGRGDMRAAGTGFMGCAYHEDPSMAIRAVDAASTTEEYVGTFVDELERLLGQKPLIYTFPSFMRWHSTHGCDLWIANFGVKSPTTPSPWSEYAMWQFSSTAHVPGVNGNCDVNRVPDLRKVLVP